MSIPPEYFCAAPAFGMALLILWLFLSGARAICREERRGP